MSGLGWGMEIPRWGALDDLGVTTTHELTLIQLKSNASNTTRNAVDFRCVLNDRREARIILPRSRIGPQLRNKRSAHRSIRQPEDTSHIEDKATVRGSLLGPWFSAGQSYSIDWLPVFGVPSWFLFFVFVCIIPKSSRFCVQGRLSSTFTTSFLFLVSS